jgi:hypothetical protein
LPHPTDASPPPTRLRPPAAPDNYNNGGQDWGTLAGNGACNITATSVQSPIDVPTTNTAAVKVNTSLPALNVAYGKATSWSLEVTRACTRAACCLAGAQRSCPSRFSLASQNLRLSQLPRGG